MIMRILGFEIDIEFDDSSNVILIVKDHKLFSNIVMQISKYLITTENNEIVFIDNSDNIIKSKDIIFVSDLLSYEIGSKQLLSKIYSNLKNSIITDIDKEDLINNAMCKINSIIIDELNDYNIDFNYDCNVNLEGYFKLLNIKINNNYDSLYDKIMDFIELFSELFYDKCVVFINTLCYFNDNEITEILKYKRLKKLNILFIENIYSGEVQAEKYIIDNDFYAYKE